MAMRAGEGSGKPREGAAAVQSVDRALTALEIVAKLGAAGVTEIAAELGVHKSTVSRLIAVLESRGYVEQLSERGKYRLGFTVVRLAGSTSAHMDLPRQSQDVCEALAARVGETTNIAILDSDRIINVAEAVGSAGISLRTWIGQSCPAHATSSGKVLLAELPAPELRTRLTRRLDSFAPNTITDLPTLRTHLDQAHRQGWAACEEELEIGLNAVAAPIRDSEGRIIAALSVSGPAYRLPPGRFAEIAHEAIDSARVISRRLGYAG
ncbi:helix-turn-helix domain-containing protein [Nocardia sp. SYP-A9097]|uniref:IclR family transcriptional regulator n=1 Tax=Nocardia sp. SYP-A9097 TaxID=2663237 RepID=UPI00129A8C2B|nr:IclR family transcriptional regulator [Nocardia sp. SYP-A9097]MRH89475.1 helix-turn-helix domain-containing protein [Nocardia sp. SYP-A9097]